MMQYFATLFFAFDKSRISVLRFDILSHESQFDTFSLIYEHEVSSAFLPPDELLFFWKVYHSWKPKIKLAAEVYKSLTLRVRLT